MIPPVQLETPKELPQALAMASTRIAVNPEPPPTAVVSGAGEVHMIGAARNLEIRKLP